MAKREGVALQEYIKRTVPTYYAINGQIRSDIKRFLSIQDKWQELDPSTIAAVKDYYLYHQTCLQTHWHNQEEHILPAIVRFFGGNQALVDAANKSIDDLHERHVGLRKMQEGILRAFERKEYAQLSNSFKAYTDYLLETTLMEEGWFSDQLPDTYNKQEFDKMDAAIFAEQDPKELKVMSEWLLAAMDEQVRADFFSKVPFFVRLAWILVLKRRFAKRIAVFNKFKLRNARYE